MTYLGTYLAGQVKLGKYPNRQKGSVYLGVNTS